jgi:hypothetical protein
MTTYRATTPDDLQFGDVCAAPFLADIRVSSDTLRVFRVADKEQLLGFPAYRESTRKPNRLVVTVGDVMDRAIMLSDDCAIETALGRGQARAKGRIWFAPLRELVTEGEVKEVENVPSAYGRLLLRPDNDSQTHWVVELQRAFPADATSVRKALEGGGRGFLLHGLAREVADDLRARWAAVSTRCGPFVARDNANHIIDRLEARGVGTAEAENAADALVAVAAASWVFEGSSLEAAGALRENTDKLSDAAVDGMIEDLTVLRDRVLGALDILEEIRGGFS